MSGALSASVISREVKRLASEVGFDLAGVAGVADTPEHRFFPGWIAEGHAGEMSYLEKRTEAGELKRASLANAAPWARSVVVCALNYNSDQPYSDARGHDVAGLDLALRLVATRLPQCGTRKIARAGSQAA